jgi:hypothetical protein
VFGSALSAKTFPISAITEYILQKLSAIDYIEDYRLRQARLQPGMSYPPRWVNEARDRENSEKTIQSGVDGQQGGQNGVQNEAECRQKINQSPRLGKQSTRKSAA